MRPHDELNAVLDHLDDPAFLDHLTAACCTVGVQAIRCLAGTSPRHRARRRGRPDARPVRRRHWRATCSLC